MRQDAGHFGEEPLELVQLARRLKEAKSVEELLTEQGIDYLLEAAPYAARLLFVIPTTRVGVYFYVRAAEAPSVRELLRARGFTIVELMDEDDEEEPAGP